MEKGGRERGGEKEAGEKAGERARFEISDVIDRHFTFVIPLKQFTTKTRTIKLTRQQYRIPAMQDLSAS